MTSEVAVLNPGAVALAADSAVTIGSQKIYNSALKLFSLSKVHPVAIMVYGNAVLMNVPWETMIKIYREQSAGTPRSTIKDYVRSFIGFLRESKSYFPKSEQEDWVTSNVHGYYTLILQEVVDKVEQKIKESGHIKDEETKQILSEVIEDHHVELRSLDYASEMDDGFEMALRKKFVPKFKEVRENVFQALPISRSQVAKLNDIANYLQTRDIFSDSRSGVVIAGFGNNEIYPVIETNEIEGFIDGRVKLKHLAEKSCKISTGRESRIIAFAQDDMVATFMNGLNPSVHRFLLSYLSQAFARLPDLLNEDAIQGDSKTKKKVLNRFEQDTKELLSTFMDQLNIHLQQEHVHPVMAMVHALPKDELAAMAESLINLTAFKRRMTRDLETVGGPIDVAVISKGDGLVWVNRKHYFPKELNQHFFANYFRGAE